MIISTQDLQLNWLERNRAELKRIMETHGVIVGPNETLADALARVYGLPAIKRIAAKGTAPEFHELSLRRLQLPQQNTLRQAMKALWKKSPQVVQLPGTDNDYLKGFAYLAVKRNLAKQKGLRWLLEEQRLLLRRLKNQAWYGKVAALGYGLAIGVGLAGYMAMTLGMGVWWMLPVVAFIAWFPMQQNFWISRRAPSELIFDLFSSPRESTDDYSWKRELFARVLGLCNALVYGGLTAYGMWEFFTVAALTATPLGMFLCAGATFVLGMMVFLPELGLGIKFNRDQLKINPIKKLLASIRVGDNGRLMKPDLNLINTLSYRQLFAQASGAHLWRFTWVFACTVVGTVFTTLAAAGMAATLMGLPFWGACTLLGIMAMSLLPFYLDKALKNAIRLHESDYEKENPNEVFTQKPVQNANPGIWGRICEQYPVLTRCVNASVNSVPAFLGGMGMLAGFGGLIVGALTGFAGGVASFLSGEDGKEVGYEEIIENELTETNEAYNELGGHEILGAPTVEVDGIRQQATLHPLMFRPFHTTAETRERELHLLNGTLPKSADMKLKTA